MPLFAATVKIIVEDPDIAHAETTIYETLTAMVGNELMAWGYSTDTPTIEHGGRKGPYPRKIEDEKLAEAFEQAMEAYNISENEEEIEELKKEIDELFKKL